MNFTNEDVAKAYEVRHKKMHTFKCIMNAGRYVCNCPVGIHKINLKCEQSESDELQKKEKNRTGETWRASAVSLLT